MNGPSDAASSEADLGTELDAWVDRRIRTRSPTGMAFEPAARCDLLVRFAALPEDLRQQVEAILRAQRAHLPQPVLSEELRACGSPEALRDASRNNAAYARRLMRTGVTDDYQRGYIERWERRQDASAWQDEAMAAVWALGHVNLDGSGFEKPLPAGLSRAQIAWALQRQQRLRWCRLWQRGEALVIEPVAGPAAPLGEVPGSVLAHLPLRSGQLAIEWYDDSGERWPELVDVPERAPGAHGAGEAGGEVELEILRASRGAQGGTVRRVTVESDLGRVQLVPHVRPAWAVGLERDSSEVWLRLLLVERPAPAASAVPDAAEQPSAPPAPQGSRPPGSSRAWPRPWALAGERAHRTSLPHQTRIRSQTCKRLVGQRPPCGNRLRHRPPRVRLGA